jgi:hypothetical protein
VAGGRSADVAVSTDGSVGSTPGAVFGNELEDSADVGGSPVAAEQAAATTLITTTRVTNLQGVMEV